MAETSDPMEAYDIARNFWLERLSDPDGDGEIPDRPEVTIVEHLCNLGQAAIQAEHTSLTARQSVEEMIALHTAELGYTPDLYTLKKLMNGEHDG